MNTLRLMRVAAAAGAVLFGTLAFAPTSASAAKPAAKASATPAIEFAGQASAAGIEYSIDSKPPPVPVAGLFDVRSPTGVSQLSSSGISQATAAIMTPGNAGSGIALLCVEAAQLCNGLNPVTEAAKLGSFPPDYPLSASSSYPENKGQVQKAKVSGQPFGKGTPASVDPDEATAQTTATSADSNAAANSSKLAAGTPIAINGGSANAVTHQQVSKNSLQVTSTTSVHDISIAGLVQIHSVSSSATATNDGKGHITKNGQVTVSGVTAMGHPATIDQHGVSINKGSLLNPAPALNAALQKALKAQGVSMKVVSGQVSQTKHEVRVSSGSLQISYHHNVTNMPNPAQYLPCFPPGSCIVGAPNPNAFYFGVAIVGEADVDNYAAPGIKTPPVKNIVTPPVSGTNGTTKFVAGTKGTLGTSGTTGTGPTGPAPQVAGPTSTGGSGAGGAVTAGDILSGTASRLKYIVPALFLAALAGFGGGLLRHPGRFPTPVDR